MLIILDKEVVNLEKVSDFCILNSDSGIIISFFSGHSIADFSFKDEEAAKKAFDRIIYAYANEYRTLDLSEYAAD